MDNQIILDKLAKAIIGCIEDATGDAIKEDIARNRLRYYNSTPTRIWDHIYSSFEANLGSFDCSVISSNSGPWHLAMIYDRTTDNIITIMREKRFATLKKQQRKRKKPHYVDVLVAALNTNLKPQYDQMTLLDESVLDIEVVQSRVNQMLMDLGGEADLVRNHVLVLFEASDFRLISARAIMVTPTLDIAVNGEVDLSKYISSHESIIMDKVSDTGSPSEKPERGLKLKKKAIERKNQLSLKENEIRKTDSNS